MVFQRVEDKSRIFFCANIKEKCKDFFYNFKDMIKFATPGSYIVSLCELVQREGCVALKDSLQ